MASSSDLDYVRQWLLLATALCTLAATLWKGRHLLRLVKHGWLTLTGVRALSDQLAGLSAQVRAQSVAAAETLVYLKEVRDQLRPNGGSSLHDLVQSLAAAQRARDDREALALFWADADGRLTHANRAYQQLTGRSREELVGTGWVNAVAVEDRERVLDLWRDAVTEARDLDDRYLLRDASGTLRGVAVHAWRLLSVDRRLLGYYGELRPLT